MVLAFGGAITGVGVIGSASPGSPLETVPASAFATMHVDITPSVGASAIPASQAETMAAQFAVMGKVLESKLAHCSYTALPPGVEPPVLPSGQQTEIYRFDRDCWVISLSAAGLVRIGERPTVGAPPDGVAATTAANPDFNYNVALVDAQTGRVLLAFRD